MTPDERQLLSGLFDRITTQSNQPRDREAESFIADRVRAQPYAPYLLSQTVIVQEQALRAAAEKIQQLEAQVQQGGAQPHEETSFLGSIGKSIFGGGSAPSPQRGSVPASGGVWGQAPQGYAPPPQQPQGGPWSQQGAPQGYAAQPAQGGGFLRGALGAAAGVAGGVLAADALSGLFGGHHNPFGIASGGFGGGGMGQPGETVVNNYYEGDPGGAGSGQFDQSAADAQQDFLQDQSDDFSDNSFDSGGDDSMNV